MLFVIVVIVIGAGATATCWDMVAELFVVLLSQELLKLVEKFTVVHQAADNGFNGICKVSTHHKEDIFIVFVQVTVVQTTAPQFHQFVVKVLVGQVKLLGIVKFTVVFQVAFIVQAFIIFIVISEFCHTVRVGSGCQILGYIS